MTYNQSKHDRGEYGIKLWRSKKGVGTLHYIMRFGKTDIGLRVAKRRLDSTPNKIIYIVVSSAVIKKQWDEELELKFKDDNIDYIKDHVIILTGNSIIANSHKLSCDLLIVDEIHKFISTELYKVIDKTHIKYKFILGLTGTYGQNEALKLDSICPVIDTISEEEAVSNGWVSPMVEYNVRLEFEHSDQLLYEKYSTTISEALALFKPFVNKFKRGDGTNLYKTSFDVLKAANSGIAITKDIYVPYLNVCMGIASIMGYTEGILDDRLRNEWNPEAIHDKAKAFNRAIRFRNNLITTNSIKASVVLDLFKLLGETMIVFNGSTDMADYVTDSINKIENNIAVSYHSNISSRALIDETTGEYHTYGKTAKKSGQLKMFGKKKILEDLISGMISGKYKVISTANALDEGLNISNISTVITTAGSTNPNQYKQRNARGRTVHYNSNKITKIYNLYFDDFISLKTGKLVKSRDKTKLIQRQTDNGTTKNNAIWTNITELIRKNT